MIGAAGLGTFIVVSFLLMALASGDSRVPRISFNATTVDFGEQFEGEEVPCIFVFRNEGRSPLHLSGVKTSCRCLVVKPSKTEIHPRERAELVASYDTRDLSGPVQSTLLVGTDDPKSPFVKLSIVGRVIRGYIWQPRVVDFGQIDAEPGAVKTVVLTKITAKPLEITDLHTSKPWLKAAVVSETPGRS